MHPVGGATAKLHTQNRTFRKFATHAPFNSLLPFSSPLISLLENVLGALIDLTDLIGFLYGTLPLLPLSFPFFCCHSIFLRC